MVAVDIARWAPRQNTRPNELTAAPVETIQTKPLSPTLSSDNSRESHRGSPELESQDRSMELPVAEKKPRSSRQVEVVIKRDLKFDPTQYEDCTAGGDVVRQVLREYPGDDIAYEVEFIDLHMEKVSGI